MLIPADDVARIKDERLDAYEIDGCAFWLNWSQEWTSPSRYQADVSDVHKGLCVGVTSLRGVVSQEPHEHGQWTLTTSYYSNGTWVQRPTRVDGVRPDDLAEVLGLILDTFRASRLRQQAARLHRGRMLQALTAAADAYDTAAAGNAKWTAGQTRDRVIEQAIEQDLLDDDEIQEAARVTELTVRNINNQVSRGARRAPLYGDLPMFAARHGLKPASLHVYRSRGKDALPPEDLSLSGTPGWLVDTIEAWKPARGPRTRQARQTSESPS